MRAEEEKFAVFHRPTGLWVYFKELKDKFGITERSLICLCHKNDASTSTFQEDLSHLIMIGEFNSVPFYGQSNFLEFQIKKI